ncbi:MAG: translation initiation factor IF-2, partial [Firmicutes bacterium]|nr:translation initiation factor IF-2 [Bacillota bacterium]
MGKVRVHELAKELKISSKELMELLGEMGITVRNHMSTLDDQMVEEVKSSLGSDLDTPEVLVEVDIDEEEELPSPRRRPAVDKKGKGKEGRDKRVTKREKSKTEGQEKTEAAPIELPENMTVQDLATRLGRPGSQVVKLLFSQGVMAGLNQTIAYDAAAKVAEKLGFVVTRVTTGMEEVEEEEDRPEDLRERPPVVTVMGHVDHGKTSL